MKWLLVLLSLVCVLNGNTQSRRLLIAPPKPASAASVTVDYWQNFEFGVDGDNPTALNLEANRAPYTNNWTIGGTTTLMFIRTAAQQAPTSAINGITDTGTRGLESDINAGNTAARYIYMDMNKGANPVSWGCRFKANSLVANAALQPILFVANIAGTIQTAVNLGTDGSGNPKLALNNGSTNGAAITLTADTWYWITCLTQNNTFSTMEVFNGAGASQGTSTSTAAALDAYFFVIGNFSAYAEIGSVFIDNVIIDVTDATYPLGP